MSHRRDSIGRSLRTFADEKAGLDIERIKWNGATTTWDFWIAETEDPRREGSDLRNMLRDHAGVCISEVWWEPAAGWQWK